MTVDRANLVYDPEGVHLTFDYQFSGFGPVDPAIGGVLLPPGSPLTPASIFINGKFREPSEEELQQGFLFVLPGHSPRTWDQLSETEKHSTAAQGAILDASAMINSQIQKWEAQHLTPTTLKADYELDLNRFVKVQNSMKILTRRLSFH